VNTIGVTSTTTKIAQSESNSRDIWACLVTIRPRTAVRVNPGTSLSSYRCKEKPLELQMRTLLTGMPRYTSLKEVCVSACTSLDGCARRRREIRIRSVLGRLGSPPRGIGDRHLLTDESRRTHNRRRHSAHPTGGGAA
jgi:hypothetical protein